MLTGAGRPDHARQRAVYSRHRNAWRLLPLTEMVAQGKASRRLTVRVRCQVCGEVGRLQVRPQVPTRSVGGGIAPP